MKKIASRNKRLQTKVRSKIIGKTEFPRLSVHRSNKYMYAQAIDDQKQVTIASETDKVLRDKKITKTESAKQLGINLAKKLLELKVKQVVFDRGYFKYTGRIRAVAEGLREGGITI